jgi:formylglycine-generating enzyme required for sulfatase activity
VSKRYAVFLSFNYYGPDGTPTPDAALAKEVFDYLRAKRVRVASKYSFKKRGAAASQSAIDDALESAQVLVAIGTSLENLDSPWVRYEWESFSSDIRSELKPEGRVLSYVSGVDVDRLPRALRLNGAIVHDPPGSLDRLYNLILNRGEEDRGSAPQPSTASRGPEAAAGPPRPASATPKRRRKVGKARASPTSRAAVMLIRRARRAVWPPMRTVDAAGSPDRGHARLRPEVVLTWLVVLLFIFCLVSPFLRIFSRSAPPDSITNRFGMTMVRIPQGKLLMDSPDSNEESSPHENSKNIFKLDYQLYFGIYEVTQRQYWKVTKKDPSFFSWSGDLPVEQVTWDDANAFCDRLNELEKDRLAGSHYRLPTEEEWEYACRAGSATIDSSGGNASSLGDYAWFRENSDGKPHPVGQKRPNKYNLFDMHGNVWEWCRSSDRAFDQDSLSSATTRVDKQNNVAPALRGGSWHDSAGEARRVRRGKETTSIERFHHGLRVVRVPSDR